MKTIALPLYTIVALPFPLERTSLPAIYDTWVSDPETTLRKDIEAILSGHQPSRVVVFANDLTEAVDGRIRELEEDELAPCDSMRPVRGGGFMEVLASDEKLSVDDMDATERLATAIAECQDYDTMLWIKAVVTNVAAILSQQTDMGSSICIFTDTVGVIVGIEHTKESDYIAFNTRSERLRRCFSKKVRRDI